MKTFKTVFLTGATGLLGRALISKLKEYQVICLIHKTPFKEHGVISIKGDITKKQLGLTYNEYQTLCKQIDVIIHMAAITDFSERKEIIENTNVVGTKNIVTLSRDADAPLYHVSTAYVYDFPNANRFGKQRNFYEISKRLAEKIVKDSLVKATIIRPSIIIGDSHHGTVSTLQGFHLLSRLIMEEKLPMLPGLPHSILDIVPQDIVAEVIFALVHNEHIGGEFYITNGQNAPMLKEVIDTIVQESTILFNKSISSPKIVDPDLFDRLIKPLFLPKLPFQVRKEIRRALFMRKYLTIEEALPSSLDFLNSHYGIKKIQDMKYILKNNIKYLYNLINSQEEKKAYRG